MQCEEEDDVEAGAEYDEDTMWPKRQVADHEVEVVRQFVESGTKNDCENNRSSAIDSSSVVVPFLGARDVVCNNEVCRNLYENWRVPQAYPGNLVVSGRVGANKTEGDNVAGERYDQGATVDEKLLLFQFLVPLPPCLVPHWAVWIAWI